MTESQHVTVGEHRSAGDDSDGDPVTLPVVQLLTGRGFVTGKSGSGKSNTASVIGEELLEAGYPLLIVDTDGEYYGLKEEYELLHAGADEECDIQIGAEHAEKIATLALEENVPVILDVSGYLDENEASELIRETARHLFTKEKKLKKPFLLVVEEVHEYIPEGGGLGETGQMLIKIGKRGRKHGLGILGISQRPADVKKDFITQANWLVWHRLTWENDTKVVGRIVDKEYGEMVSDLGDGEAFLQTDWTEADVRRIQFRRKRTFDAGATPGLDDFERPELKSVSDTLVGDLQDITEQQEQERNRVAELESELERKEERIAELKSELESARDVSAAARKMANALRHGDVAAEDDTQQTQLPTEETDDRQRKRIERLEADLEATRERIEELEAENERLRDENERLAEQAENSENPEVETLEERVDELETALAQKEIKLEQYREYAQEQWASDGASEAGAPDRTASSTEDDARTSADGGSGAAARGTGASGDAPVVSDGNGAEDGRATADDMALLRSDPVQRRIALARRDSLCNEEYAWDVLTLLASEGPLRPRQIEPRVDAPMESVRSLLTELRTDSLVARDDDGAYDFDRRRLRRIRDDEA
ncbi:DUF87 domain-containing protein [Halostella sp. JP-L12]|uniref:helicase HerA domain-containing protein n=1 Tax=Halostella TaxID=1843185 RepID=UPI000EF7D0CE|nr:MULTISPECIES: DUF87 domain-containing protein [Halostella]NHN48909.1 DUF87 domain-containing protein [Halostella sp. JP-L12]